MHQVLYSDAFYGKEVAAEASGGGIPKGRYHVDLRTALEGRSIGVDIARFGSFVSMKLNGFLNVYRRDGVVKDGVIHEISSVLLPPKTPGGDAEEVSAQMPLDEFIGRLDGRVDEL